MRRKSSCRCCWCGFSPTKDTSSLPIAGSLKQYVTMVLYIIIILLSLTSEGAQNNLILAFIATYSHFVFDRIKVQRMGVGAYFNYKLSLGPLSVHFYPSINFCRQQQYYDSFVNKLCSDFSWQNYCVLVKMNSFLFDNSNLVLLQVETRMTSCFIEANVYCINKLAVTTTSTTNRINYKHCPKLY